MSDSRAPSEVRPSPLDALTSPEERDSISAGFVGAARVHPERRALSDPQRTLSYAELERASRELGEVMQELAGSGSRIVAIHGHRNAGLIVSMLASARAGFSFAVLDASYPPDRLRRMASVIDPALIVGDAEAAPDWRGLFGGLPQAAFLSTNSSGVALAAPALRRSSPGAVDERRAELAYLLFTSGTTGTPKCIATRHAPLIHFVSWYQDTFRPGPGDRFSLLSGLGHDPVLRDIFVPLASGAEICIPSQALIANPRTLFEWVRSSEISFMHGTPQLLKLLTAGAAEGQSAKALRHVFSGGDVLRRSLAADVYRLAPRAELVNFYGTTETPQAMTYHVVRRHESSDVIPIGKGIRDAQLLVLSEANTLAAVGTSGQIGIRTRFLSAGYLGDPTATRERFIKSPFTGREDDLIYLTGDYGFYRDDGEVVIQGRADDQVKIRGFRVELAEINRVMEGVPGVRGAVALAHSAPNGENVLVAYVAADAATRDTTERGLDAALKASLPAYMVPARRLWLERLPLLPNGKVDRQALAALLEARQAELHQMADADADGPEAALAHQWRQILGIAGLDPNASFVEMGGDSLSFIQASLAVEKVLGWLPDDWDHTPLSELAARGRQEASGWHQLGSTIVVRAVAITLIVLGHFGPYGVAGTTSALFVISGWSFAKFQLRAVLTQESTLPIFSSTMKVVLPTLLATAYQNWAWGTLRQNWWAFLMISNYLPLGKGDVAGFWFIDVLVQIFGLLAVLFSFRSARAAYERDPYRFALVATLATMAGGMLVHLAWNTQHLTNWVPHMKLWLVFYGMALLSADSIQRQLPLVAIGLFAAMLGHFNPFAMIGTTFVMFVKRVPVPAILAPIITSVAASSLFIYVTHDALRTLVHDTLLGASPVAETCSVIAGGVLIGMAWNSLYPAFLSLLSRKPVAAPDLVGG